MARHDVLLVEDNADHVALIERAFRKANIASPLRVVGDGDAAIGYLGASGEFAARADCPIPALILLDLKLPKRDGLEVLTWVRRQESLRRIPVVVLTSSRENKDVNRAYDLGANSYLRKPVQFDELLDIVKHLNVYWLVMNEPPQVERQGV
jgi:CheY-like chemotaxis protein